MRKNTQTSGKIHLPLDAKVGLLHTIAHAVYASLTVKLREAVANSMDNDATSVLIYADARSREIGILDDGTGIASSRFAEIFEGIGYGDSADDETTLSYFGLGLMSVLRLGERAAILTRSKAEGETLRLSIDTSQILSPGNRDKKLREMREYVSLDSAAGEEIHARTLPELRPLLEGDLDRISGHFTEILVSDVPSEDIDRLQQPDFLDDLSRTLPLPVARDEPFLKRFSQKTRAKIRTILSSDRVCPHVNVAVVVLGIEATGDGQQAVAQETPRPAALQVRQLYKHFPRFRRGLDFPDERVILLSPSTNRPYAAYIVYSSAKDLYREEDGPESGDEQPHETGLWIRNHNFLVKGGDFLKKPGPGRPCISRPVSNWIYGEVFHSDLNELLTASREDFLYDTREFAEFREELLKPIRPLDSTLRRMWDQQKHVVDSVITPLSKFGDPHTGTIWRLEQQLRHLVDSDDWEEEVLRNLPLLPSCERWRDTPTVLEIISKSEQPIVLRDDKTFQIGIDPRLSATPPYYVSSLERIEDPEQGEDVDRVLISIAPCIFADQSTVFVGESYTVDFVAGQPTDPPIAFDLDEKRIRINPFNADVCDFSISKLDVILALEFAYLTSGDDKADYKKKVQALLGLSVSDDSWYASLMTPLSEEIHRHRPARGHGAGDRS